MGEPPRRAGCQRGQELRARVQKRDAAPSEQPLEAPATIEVGVERLHIHRQLAGGVIAIDEEQRSFAVRDLCDGADVLNCAGRVVDVTGRHQRRVIVDRAGKSLDRYADPVNALHHDDFHPFDRLGQPLVGHGGKVETRHHHLRAPAIVERLGHSGEGARHIGVKRDRSVWGAKQTSIPEPELGECRPPDLVPRRRPARLPEIEAIVDPGTRAEGQRPERATVEVNGVAEDGKLRPVVPRGSRGRDGGHSGPI